MAFTRPVAVVIRWFEYLKTTNRLFPSLRSTPVPTAKISDAEDAVAADLAFETAVQRVWRDSTTR